MVDVGDWLQSPLPQQIVTKRLLLRLPMNRDVPEIVRQLGNFDVSKRLGRVPHPYAAWHGNIWLRTTLAKRATGQDLAFAVVLRAKPARIIGVIGVHNLDAAQQVLGYWLAKPAWGHGYVTEAARAIIACVFELKPDAQLTATVLPDNPGSIGVLEKVGFKRRRRPQWIFSRALRRKRRVLQFAQSGPTR